MAKTRDIIVHVSVEQAGKQRKCHHKPKKHSIAKGEHCLVVKGGAFNAGKNYCSECAAEMLKLAEDRLEQIRMSLNA
jgi:predicted nucleic acid-binding Zn ribbon protein